MELSCFLGGVAIFTSSTSELAPCVGLDGLEIRGFILVQAIQFEDEAQVYSRVANGGENVQENV
jgi:hypothetical protein